MHRILELYSGIGGMHCAWKESKLDGDIILAVDVNNVANDVYSYNFPKVRLLNRNIQSLTSADIRKLNVNTVLMSPPCQPFTRNGKYLDENDPRTNSFIHIIKLLPQLNNIEYILMENVKGFECSTVRNMYIDSLKECGFKYQEFLLSPSNVGVPNSRLRYYCIARRSLSEWSFESSEDIITTLHGDYGIPNELECILQTDVPDYFIVDDKMLKRGKVLDICFRNSQRSCCFTKAYTHYADGTGSVYTEASPEQVKKCYEIANSFEPGSHQFIEALKDLKLRYFTPTEVLSLMSFPPTYKFPLNVTIKQRYRLLGNSVNVKVIRELLKILFK